MNDEIETKAPAQFETAILLNFGTADRVINNYKGKGRLIAVGGAETIDISPRTAERIRTRDTTLVLLPPDIEDKSTGPYMRRVMQTLKNFNNMSYDECLGVCIAVLGEGAFESPRPGKSEMRIALARRAKDAAHYIQAGAMETADKLLGEGREVKLQPSQNGVGVTTSDVVQGDPEENDDELTDEQRAQHAEFDIGSDAVTRRLRDAEVLDAEQRHAGAHVHSDNQTNDAGGLSQASGGTESSDGGGDQGEPERRIRPVTGKATPEPGKPARVER